MKTMNKGNERANGDHIVIFPFMAKGHTIPLIHLASSLHADHGLRITFITTPANAPFLRKSLHPDIQLITLPFPQSPHIPSGCESTDALPSIDLHPLFVSAASALRHPFESLLAHLLCSPHPPLCLISDFFLGWTLPVCCRFNLPRIVFHGMSAYSMAICKSLFIHLPSLPIETGRDPFHVPGTPDALLLDKSEIPEFFLKMADFDDQAAQAMAEAGEGDVNSWGVLINSFADIEGEYVDLLHSFYQNGGRSWLVGPLCLLSPLSDETHGNECILWLNQQEPGSVVYVSFGTQADMSMEQLDEVAHGLAESGARFLWALRFDSWAPPEVVLRDGKIVSWAPQRELLGHPAVGGFLSHCGWNSALESVSAGVPLLTWPMIAEQTLNAKMVVEELRVGVKLGMSAGEVVKRERVAEGVRELMERGEKGVRLRDRAAQLKAKAKAAVEEGGSSQRRLKELIGELRKCYEERDVDEMKDIFVDEEVMKFDLSDGCFKLHGQVDENQLF